MSRPLARFGELCFGCPRRVSARLSAPFSSGHLTPSPLGVCHDRARTGAHLERIGTHGSALVPLAQREKQSKFPGRDRLMRTKLVTALAVAVVCSSVLAPIAAAGPF